MGSAQDIMQSFIQKDLNARFPGENGWNFNQVSLDKKTDMIYRVSRHYRRENQYALIAISLEKKVSDDQVTVLKSIPRDSRSFEGHYVLVPQNADVTSVPWRRRGLFS